MDKELYPLISTFIFRPLGKQGEFHYKLLNKPRMKL